MTAPDKNFLSFSGDDQGNIWKNGEILFSAIIPGMREINVGDLIPPPEFGPWSDTLKLSGCKRLRVIAGLIQGGLEDCVDINHSEDCAVLIEKASSGGTYIATIKGGSHSIAVTVDQIVRSGSVTDFDLGNFTEASQDETFDVILSLGQGSGKVRQINAETPSLYGQLSLSNPFWAYWPFCQIYSWFRLRGWFA